MKEQPTPPSTGPVCPVCGDPLPKGSRFCYTCGLFVDPAHKRPLQYGEVTDEDLSQLVTLHDQVWKKHKQTKGAKITKVALSIMLILVLISIVLIFNQHLLLGGGLFAAAVLMGSIISQIFDPPVPKENLTKPCYKKALAAYLMPQPLSQSFDTVLDYLPSDGLGLEHIRSTGLVQDPFTDGSTFDRLKVVYRGQALELCNVSLQELTNPDADSSEDYHYRPVFVGQWMSFQLDVHPRCDIQFVDQKAGLGWGRTSTGLAEYFEDAFVIRCANWDYADTMLTEPARAALLALRQQAGGRCYLSVSREGRVELGIDNDRALLAVPNIHEPPAQLRARFLSEMQYITGLLDLLLDGVD